MEPLNWAAIAAGTIVAFLAGWLIYSPRVFGTAWAEGSGVTLPEKGEAPPVAPLVVQVIALILLALVIGVTAQTNALGTAVAAILACAGFVASNGAFSGKSTKAIVIDGGYVLLAGILMIVAQGVF